MHFARLCLIFQFRCFEIMFILACFDWSLFFDVVYIIELIGYIGGDSVDGMDLSNKCGENLPLLSETAEPEIPRKTGKLNLRKSLAWDKAFFESPGLTWNQNYAFLYFLVYCSYYDC